MVVVLNGLVSILVNSPYTPHEQVTVTRTATITKKNGAEDTLTENVGQFTVFIAPPDTLNKDDGAILQQLMSGNKSRKVLMMYGITTDIKDGDTVYRQQTDKLYYEVKIVGFHGDGNEYVPISHHKCYIVSKDEQGLV